MATQQHTFKPVGTVLAEPTKTALTPPVTTQTIQYIDLFAGLGGIRLGFEVALQDTGLQGRCVFASEIKPLAVATYRQNFQGVIAGDIQTIATSFIPDCDILLAGFPCQAFSTAGRRQGFKDARGVLFFDILRILKAKQPAGFILENVEGLVRHQQGATLKIMLAELRKLGYVVNWRVLDSSRYGTPQRRKRIYVVGTMKRTVDLDKLPETASLLSQCLERVEDQSVYLDSPFVKKLLAQYSLESLKGKQIKDTRGGNNNIHSWEVGYKGKVTKAQTELLSQLLKQRRRKHWAEEKQTAWADGMALTLKDISTFSTQPKQQLVAMLDDLVNKGYLKKNQGYDIVAGKLSFEVNHILNPGTVAPTIVATDANRLAVADCHGLRRLTLREGLRLFGYPENYVFPAGVTHAQAFDLLGNSVCINTIRLVAQRLLQAL